MGRSSGRPVHNFFHASPTSLQPEPCLTTSSQPRRRHGAPCPGPPPSENTVRAVRISPPPSAPPRGPTRNWAHFPGRTTVRPPSSAPGRTWALPRTGAISDLPGSAYRPSGKRAEAGRDQRSLRRARSSRGQHSYVNGTEVTRPSVKPMISAVLVRVSADGSPERA